MSSDPHCPICCETLGVHGGPTTLPCGHNGCLECLQSVQTHRSECPLCRSAFDKELRLSLNTELRDLIDLATRLRVDESDQQDEWEVVPTPEDAAAGSSARQVEESEEYVAMPSAPPLMDGILDMEERAPPVWMPDSSSMACLDCGRPFLPVVRLRHHCRLCGGLFCHACSSQRCFLPPKHLSRTPQRVCDACATLLSLFQAKWMDVYNRANLPPVYDTFDWCSVRSWMNSPYSSSMEQDIYKAANIVRTFQTIALKFPGLIPTEVLDGAQGIAVLSEIKVAFGVWSCRLGTGLVMARRGQEKGGWSQPCAIGSASIGAGLQIGGQLMDIVIVLPTQDSVDAFSGDVRVGICAGLSASLGVGPGFHTLLSLKVNRGPSARVAQGHCFCLCRGGLIGASLDGSVLFARNRINESFYGGMCYPSDLLSRDAPPPAASAQLIKQLDLLFGTTPLNSSLGRYGH